MLIALPNVASNQSEPMTNLSSSNFRKLRDFRLIGREFSTEPEYKNTG